MWMRPRINHQVIRAVADYMEQAKTDGVDAAEIARRVRAFTYATTRQPATICRVETHLNRELGVPTQLNHLLDDWERW